MESLNAPWSKVYADGNVDIQLWKGQMDTFWASSSFVCATEAAEATDGDSMPIMWVAKEVFVEAWEVIVICLALGGVWPRTTASAAKKLTAAQIAKELS